MAPARSLLSGLIDHAPLFPPASLPLEEALEDHRRALASPQAWMVGRFVCPASQLGDIDGEPLRLSVVMDIAEVALDERIEAVEGRDPALARLGRETYVEIQPDADLAVIKAAGARAKVRCGPTPPPVEALAGFIRRCRAENIPFKATAGLHHAVRTDGQLGFLNLLAAAVFGDEERALDEDDAGAFSLDSAFRWRDREASPDEVAEVRRSLFVSIGSCSFAEPVGELEELGFL
jgi:hypothetical protein